MNKKNNRREKKSKIFKNYLSAFTRDYRNSYGLLVGPTRPPIAFTVFYNKHNTIMFFYRVKCLACDNFLTCIRIIIDYCTWIETLVLDCRNYSRVT